MAKPFSFQPNKKRKNKKKANGEKAGDKPGSAPPAGPTNAKGEPLVNGKSGLTNGDLSHSKYKNSRLVWLPG